jgi:tubulin alpha
MISDTALDQIRKISEACNSLEGFIMTHSVGGGTGAGLGTLLLEKLSVDYGKTPKFTNTVYPSPRYETSVL